MFEKPMILFDGECNLCNWAVNFVLAKDRRGIFAFSPRQSDPGRRVLAKRGLENTDVETIYLVENDNIYSQSTAVLFILRRLPLPWKLLFVFIVVPRYVRDFLYDVIARNRYAWFGKTTSCRVPSPREKDRFLS
jgi:predicted DCC family thiol-disulfide oxidoreductase YuxK